MATLWTLKTVPRHFFFISLNNEKLTFCFHEMMPVSQPVYCPVSEEETGDGEGCAGQTGQEEHMLSHHQATDEWPLY